ncbi:chain length determinant protein [Providencia rettgeri DSM 1131]|uniref:Wzz/FepE/Etk N-terminal domain-containing protein n=1 Tax=Providencia rettgeri TaxID=587 RepID=UPI000197C70A|nr:chain length determinant protein [Providencia rettgeri DSM 1131]QXA58860.1 chain-length determining protein [Providencia rettgeri]
MNIKNDNHDEIDIFQLMHLLWQNRKTLFMIIAFFFMMGCAYLVFAKSKWVSEAIISPPDIGQLANYPEAVNLNFPKTTSPNGNELTTRVFNRYLANIEAYITQEKATSPVSITKSKEMGYYVISFSAQKAKTAQLELADLLAELNQQTRTTLYQTAAQALDTRRHAVQQRLQAQEAIAKRKQQQRVVLLENALQIAKNTQLNINEIKQLPSIIPDEALFMMGVPALEALLKQERDWPLQFSDEYYDDQLWLTLLSNFRLDERHFHAYTLVSPPSLAVHRSSPKVVLVMVLSVILGGIIGGAYVLAQEAFSTRALRLHLPFKPGNEEPK